MRWCCTKRPENSAAASLRPPALSFKDGFRRYFDYTVRKTNECGARIVLGWTVDEKTVRAEAPDALVIATGALPILPPVKGMDGPNVVGCFGSETGEKRRPDKRSSSAAPGSPAPNAP